MARGAVGKVEAALGVIGLVALATTYVIISGNNPLPAVGTAVQGWLDRAGSLSHPETAWTGRLGDQPTAATVAGNAVVFSTRSGAEVLDVRDGRALWSHEAEWVAVAGDGATSVVILGRGRTGGYDAVSPMTGVLRWHDAGIAVWAYRDALLSLACPAEGDCMLSARSTIDGRIRWTTKLSRGARLLTGARVSQGELPPVVGLPIDGRVQAIDTATGARLHQDESTASTRVTVVGGRIVRASAERSGGNCRYTVEGRDAATGRTVWRRDGYDVGTASAADCEQRRDPAGAPGALVATRGDNRPAILSAADGRELWTGVPGDSVVMNDGRGAVVRSADHRSIKLIDLGGGGTAWTHAVTPGSDVTLVPDAVVVMDDATGQLVAYGRTGGATLTSVTAQASVLGSGPGGLVLGRGRTVGVLAYHASAR